MKKNINWLLIGNIVVSTIVYMIIASISPCASGWFLMGGLYITLNHIAIKSIKAYMLKKSLQKALPLEVQHDIVEED